MGGREGNMGGEEKSEEQRDGWMIGREGGKVESMLLWVTVFTFIMRLIHVKDIWSCILVLFSKAHNF